MSKLEHAIGRAVVDYLQSQGMRVVLDNPRKSGGRARTQPRVQKEDKRPEPWKILEEHPQFPDWCDALVAPILAAPRTRRAAMILQLTTAPVEFPNGMKAQIPRRVVKQWVAKGAACSPKQARKTIPKHTEISPAATQRERSELQSTGAIGNPVEFVDKPALARKRRDCPAISECTGFAAGQGWSEFTCIVCTGPGRQVSQQAPGKRMA